MTAPTVREQRAALRELADFLRQNSDELAASHHWSMALWNSVEDGDCDDYQDLDPVAMDHAIRERLREKCDDDAYAEAVALGRGTCNTTCCALGWGAMLRPDLLAFLPGEVVSRSSLDQMTDYADRLYLNFGMNAAVEVYGISRYEAMHIFVALDYYNGIGMVSDADEVTPRMVADRIYDVLSRYDDDRDE